MIDISVIIPVYNAEKYLRGCLDSLVNQTKKEIEIVAVDDGSTDSSVDILNEYKEKYPELFKIILQPNQRQGAARNNGMRNSVGKYITFVDSDDSLKADALECLYEKAVAYDCDVVACDADCIYPDKTVIIKSGVDFETKEISADQKKKLLLDMYMVIWNKIYKRELFFDNDIFFQPEIWYEDVLFLNMLISKVKSISFVDKSLYNYYQRENSVTYTYSEKLNDILYVMKETVRYYKENGIFEKYYDELEYMYARYMLATYIKRLSKSKDKRRFDKGVDTVLAEVKSAFPNYKKNKYLKKGLKNLYIRFFNKALANVVFVLEKNKMN